ncbi:MAG: AAA family ATPase [Spirochaetales bacterium]|nr:AAA family ATPase [Spirochaetales bacterium]
MTDREISRIRKTLQALPRGSINLKTVNGKQYEYWQFREGGKQVSRRVKGEELENLRLQIEERKRLEKLLRQSGTGKIEVADSEVKILVDDELEEFAAPVRDFRKRGLFRNLEEYVYGRPDDRVMILYGLRRTGKTTMIRQLINEMSYSDLKRTSFIQISERDTLAGVNSAIKSLISQNKSIIFIDEVTLISDFIEGAALFSDIFAARGIKIILSGTDSLGFAFSRTDQLYDRCRMIHTTFIPYHEFEYVLGIRGIDLYIRFGGTMSLGGENYNKMQMPFASEKSTNEYVDSAIASNIQHSLANYQSGGHFRSLLRLYENGELTNVINRVVEDMNHRFTVAVINERFISHDLGLSKRNLLVDKNNPSEALEQIDEKSVTGRLMALLDIMDKENRMIDITEEQVKDIQDYLGILDLVHYVDVININNPRKNRTRTVFSQPGLRYSQAEALVTSLLQDESFRSIGIRERMRITCRILSEVRGRMMEDIVVLETQLSNPSKNVFVLQFAIGEIDMVVFDPETIECEIYEIKHSEVPDERQTVHLTDADKLAEIEKQYGTIRSRSVIYRGQSMEVEGIHYVNVEEYLNGLH